MVNCAVLGCHARCEKKDVACSRFPTSQPRRRLWIAALRRKDFNPSEGARICGAHFDKGTHSWDPRDPDYVPHLKLGYDTGVDNANVRARAERAAARTSQISQLMVSEMLDPLELDETLSGDEEIDAMSIDSEIDEHSLLVQELSTKVSTLESMNQRLIEDNQRLSIENENLKQQLEDQKFGISFLAKKNMDYKTKFFTGVPNYKTFLWILSFISSVLPNSNHLSSGDILLLVLMKLKLNLKLQDLAYRFNVSKTTASNILNKSLPRIADKLLFLVRWPSKEEIRKHLPSEFKHSTKYKKCRVILDCTEIFIERSRNLNLQALTWSQYKHHNTIKVLIGISPTGAITFLSKAFGGRISDKAQTQQSGILNLIEPGDLVLADRGFLIAEDLAAVGARLAIPAFTKNKKQLSYKDVQSTRQLAHVRIHVERAIERIKNYDILSSILPLSLLIHCDNILLICAAISNLQPKLIK